MTDSMREKVKQVIQAINAGANDAVAHAINADWCEENNFPDAARFLRAGDWLGAMAHLFRALKTDPRNQMNPSILFPDFDQDAKWIELDYKHFPNTSHVVTSCDCGRKRSVFEDYGNVPIAMSWMHVDLTFFEFRSPAGPDVKIAVGKCSACGRVYWTASDYRATIRLCEFIKENPDAFDRHQALKRPAPRHPDYPWSG